MSFDAFELCSAELQKKLQPVRDMFEADDEARAEAQLAGKQEGQAKQKNISVNQKDGPPKEYERFDFADGELLVLQWIPLNVITDNVINRLILSEFLIPARTYNMHYKHAAYCNHYIGYYQFFPNR